MRERERERRVRSAIAREYEDAGDRAMAQFAYIEAGVQFEQALTEIAQFPKGLAVEDEVRTCGKLGSSLFYGARPDLATPWLELALQGCFGRTLLEKKIPEVVLWLPAQYWLESRTPEALACAEQIRDLARSSGDEHLLERTNLIVENYLVLLGRYQEVLAQFRQHEKKSDDREMADASPTQRAISFSQRAIVAAIQGNAEAAFENFDRAVDTAKQSPDGYNLTVVWDDYANWATVLGRMDIARSCRERALLVARERRIAWRIPYLTLRFAGLLVTIGDYQHARDLFVEANTYDTETPVLRVLRATVGIELARALDDSDLLKRLADERTLELAFQSQEPQRIAPLVAAYAKSRLAAGTPRGVRSLIARGLAAVTQADQAGELLSLAAQYASPKDALRAREVLLDRLRLPNHRTAEAYLELWNAYAARRRKAAGALHAHAERAAELFGKLGWHQHRDEALALTGKVRQNQTGAATQRPAILSDPSLRLTDREQQVTELVLRGMTNRAIAQTLGISEHTVETHMTSILSRLGLRSRWQLRDLN